MAEISNFARKWRIEYNQDTLDALAIFRNDPRHRPWAAERKLPELPDGAGVRAPAGEPPLSGADQGQDGREDEVAREAAGAGARQALVQWLARMQRKAKAFADASSRGEKRRLAEDFDPVNVLAGIGIEVSLQRVYQFRGERAEICKTLIQLLASIEEDFAPNLKIEAYSIGLVRVMENVLYVLVASCGPPSYRVPLQRVIRHMLLSRTAPHIARNRLEVSEFFLKKGMQKLLREPRLEGTKTSRTEKGGEQGEAAPLGSRRGSKTFERAAFEKSQYEKREIRVRWCLVPSEGDAALEAGGVALASARQTERSERSSLLLGAAPDEGAATGTSSPQWSELTVTKRVRRKQAKVDPAGGQQIDQEATNQLRLLLNVDAPPPAHVDASPPADADPDARTVTTSGVDYGALNQMNSTTNSSLNNTAGTGKTPVAKERFPPVPRGRARADWWSKWRMHLASMVARVRDGKWAPPPKSCSPDVGASVGGAPTSAEGVPPTSAHASLEQTREAAIASRGQRESPEQTQEIVDLSRLDEVAEDPDTWLEDFSEACGVDPVRESVMLSLFKQNVQPLVCAVWPDLGAASIELFGSCVNGFMTKNSDLDCGIRFSKEVEDALDREAFWCDWRRGLERQMKVLRRSSSAVEQRDSQSGEHHVTGAQHHQVRKGQQERMFDFMSVTRGILVGLRKLAPVLEAAGFDVERVENARIPLLRCQARLKVETSDHHDEQRSGTTTTREIAVCFDISCGHEVVFENSRLLRLYSDVHPVVKPLALLLKHWAKARGINDSLTGTLSSYSYVLLLISFLQKMRVLPNLQPKGGSEGFLATLPIVGGRNVVLPPPVTMDHGSAVVQYFDWQQAGWTVAQLKDAFALRDDLTLSELLEEFFFYYGYDFDFWINVVSIRGSEKEKEARKKKIDFYGIKEAVSNEEEDERQDHVWGLMRKKSWLSIEDPFEIDRILGTNAKGQERLTYELRRGYEICRSGKLAKLGLNSSFLQRRQSERDFVHPIQALISYDKEFSSSNWLAECSIGRAVVGQSEQGKRERTTDAGSSAGGASRRGERRDRDRPDLLPGQRRAEGKGRGERPDHRHLQEADRQLRDHLHRDVNPTKGGPPGAKIGGPEHANRRGHNNYNYSRTKGKGQGDNKDGVNAGNGMLDGGHGMVGGGAGVSKGAGGAAATSTSAGGIMRIPPSSTPGAQPQPYYYDHFNTPAAELPGGQPRVEGPFVEPPQSGGGGNFDEDEGLPVMRVHVRGDRRDNMIHRHRSGAVREAGAPGPSSRTTEDLPPGSSSTFQEQTRLHPAGVEPLAQPGQHDPHHRSSNFVHSKGEGGYNNHNYNPPPSEHVHQPPPPTQKGRPRQHEPHPSPRQYEQEDFEQLYPPLMQPPPSARNGSRNGPGSGGGGFAPLPRGGGGVAGPGPGPPPQVLDRMHLGPPAEMNSVIKGLHDLGPPAEMNSVIKGRRGVPGPAPPMEGMAPPPSSPPRRGGLAPASGPPQGPPLPPPGVMLRGHHDRNMTNVGPAPPMTNGGVAGPPFPSHPPHGQPPLPHADANHGMKDGDSMMKGRRGGRGHGPPQHLGPRKGEIVVKGGPPRDDGDPYSRAALERGPLTSAGGPPFLPRPERDGPGMTGGGPPPGHYPPMKGGLAGDYPPPAGAPPPPSGLPSGGAPFRKGPFQKGGPPDEGPGPAPYQVYPGGQAAAIRIPQGDLGSARGGAPPMHVGASPGKGTTNGGGGHQMHIQQPGPGPPGQNYQQGPGPPGYGTRPDLPPAGMIPGKGPPSSSSAGVPLGAPPPLPALDPGLGAWKLGNLLNQGGQQQQQHPPVRPQPGSGGPRNFQ